MYTFVKAYLRKPPYAAWLEEVDVGDWRLVDLYQGTKDIYLYLTNSFLKDSDGNLIEIGLDMMALKSSLQGSLMTVNEWLVSLGNASLPTENPPKTTKVSQVRFRDIYKDDSDWRLYRIYEDSHPSSEYPLEDRRNLLLWRTEGQYTTFLDNHLITLNGIIHYAEHAAYGIMVRNAVDTLETANIDTVGLVDFSELGGITAFRHPVEKIGQDSNGNPLGRRIEIEFDEDIEDANLGLVFLGKLHLLGKTLYKVGSRRLIFDLERVDMAGIYQYLVERVDLSSLNLPTKEGEEDIVRIEDLLKGEVIRAMWELPQTFMVKFPGGEVGGSIGTTIKTGVPNRVLVTHDIDCMLLGPHGYYLDYWKRPDYGHFVVNFVGGFTTPKLQDLAGKTQRLFSEPHQVVVHPDEPWNVQTLTLYRETLETP